MENQIVEDVIFEIIDRCRPLCYPEQWNAAFLDYSRNEIFTVLYIYRKKSANMTELSEYIDVPLNTMTGIVTRLEKRGVIKRERDLQDKRVVTICMTDIGTQLMKEQMEVFETYYKVMMQELSQEELSLAWRLFDKVVTTIQAINTGQKDANKEKKKIRKIVIE